MNMLTILVFVFLIWAVGKWIFDSMQNGTNNEEEQKECYKCGEKINNDYKNKCPHCLATIVPNHIKKELDDLRILKNILLVWKNKNRISDKEYDRLNTLYEEDWEKIIDKIKNFESVLKHDSSEKRPSPPIVLETTKKESQPITESPKSPEIKRYPLQVEPKSSLPLGKPNNDVKPPEIFDSKPAPKPEIKPVAKLNKNEKQSSGFLNESSIKLMLYVGASLFILGTSIFVKNYWDIIPGSVKFVSLLFVTIATYFTGYLLLKKNKILKTANTLIILGSLLIPYNFFAVNNFALLGTTIDWRLIWLLASFVCLPLYIFNYLTLKPRLFIYASLTVYTVMTYLIADLMQLPERFFPLLFIVFSLLVPIMLAKYLKHKNRSAFETTIFDLHIFANAIGIILLIYLAKFIEIVLTNGSINVLPALSCLLLTIFYIMDSFLVEKPIILYLAGISYYLGILFFAAPFNPTPLKYIAAFSFGAFLSEAIFGFIKPPFENTNYFKPLLRINYSLMIIISIGVFSIEIVNFIGQYLLNFNLAQFLNYKTWDIFLISIIAIGCLFLLQKRKKQSIHTYFLLGYSYSLVFSLMQALIPVSYHGFGFIFLGVSGILLEGRLEKNNFDAELILPIKYFSHIFMFIIVIYTLIKYVMGLVTPDDYVLVVFRLSGLFLFYSIWFYLHRNNLLIYLLSFLYYFIFIILTVNILHLNQYSLILSIATIPLLLLHVNLRKTNYSMRVLTILSFVYSLAFYISVINGFYIYPQIATDLGLAYSALASLGIILAVVSIYEYLYQKPILAYLSSILFYLFVFVAAYPVVAPVKIALVMASTCMISLGLYYFIKNKLGSTELTFPILIVSHLAQIAITSFFIANNFYHFNFDYSFVLITTLILQSLYYYLLAYLDQKNFYNYIGGILNYLTIFVFGWFYNFGFITFSLTLICMGLVQLTISKLFSIYEQDTFSDSYFYLSLTGAALSIYLIAAAFTTDNLFFNNIFLLVLPLQIAYFAIITTYRKIAFFEYPAVGLFWFFVYLITKKIGLTIPQQFLVLTITGYVSLGLAYFVKRLREDLFDPIFILTHLNMLLILCIMLLNAYYFKIISPNTILITIMFQIIFYALNSFIQKNSYYLYPSGLLLYLMLWILLPHFRLSFMNLWIPFLPLSCIYTIVSGFLKKRNKENSANVLFVLGQIAIIFVLISLSLHRSFFFQEGINLFSILIFIITLIYVSSSLIYKRSFSVYFGIVLLVFLLFLRGIHWKFVFFEFNLSFMIFAGLIYLIARLISGFLSKENEPVMVGPFNNIAASLLAITFVSSIVRFAVYTLNDAGQLMPPGELNVAMLVTFIVTIVYGATCYRNKDARYLYFSIGSFILLYTLILRKLELNFNSAHYALIAPLLYLGDSYFYRIKKEQFAQPFFVFVNGLIIITSYYALKFSTNLSQSIIFLIGSFGYGAMIFYRKQSIYSYLSILFFGAGFITSISYIPESHYYLSFYLIALTTIYILCGRLFLAFQPNLDLKPFRQAGFIVMIISLIFSLPHLEYAYIIFGIYAILVFSWGILKKNTVWHKFAYSLILIAYELLMVYLKVEIIEFYTVPLGLSLLIWGITIKERKKSSNWLFRVGLSIIYLPSLVASLNETWGLHGIFLGCIALSLFLLGLKLSKKVIIIYSVFILLTNGVVHSQGFFRTVPRWVYLTLGGTLLIFMGMMFELKREKLQAVGKQLLDKWRDWE